MNENSECRLYSRKKRFSSVFILLNNFPKIYIKHENAQYLIKLNKSNDNFWNILNFILYELKIKALSANKQT